jgi:HEAT repeat protein
VLGPVSARALPLLAKLHHRDPRQREEAAQALASLAEPGTLGHLALPLDDPDEGVRVAVVHALSALADPRKVRLLGIALLDEAHAVREAALEALAKAHVDTSQALQRAREPRAPLGPRARDANTGAVDPRRVHRGAAAAKLSRDDAALVVALLQDYSATVVRDAAAVAGKLRLPAAVGPLCAAARTVTPDSGGDGCLREIVEALAKIGDPEGIPILVSAVDHADSSISDRALAALAGTPGDAARAALVGALASKNENLRIGAARMLGERKDPETLPSLVKALRDSDWYVRSCAAQALVAIGDPVGLRALVSAAIAGDTHVAEAAHVRLIQIGDPRTEEILSKAVQYSGVHDYATTATTFMLSGHAGLAAAGKAALARSKRAPAKGVKPVAWGSRPLDQR